MRSKGHINNYVAHRLREVRAEKQISAQEMARRTGIAPGSYSCLENGWYRINLDNLFKILKGLETEVADVWPRFEEDPQATIDDKYLKDAVDRSMAERPRRATLDDIFQSVSLAFDISKDKLESRMRNWKRLTQARAACAILVKETPRITMSSLAGSLGCSISSMSHLARRYSERLDEDSDWEARLREARANLSAVVGNGHRGNGAGLR